MNKLIIKTLVLTLMTTLVASSLKSQTLPSGFIDSLDQYLVKKRYPGLMLSIVNSDTIIYEGGLGFANVDKKQRVTAQTLFRQGSISKSFTALALVKLLQSKNLKLQTPIREIDPEIPFTNLWEAETPITVEHLLEHTTGFDGWHTHAMYNFTDSIAPSTRSMVQSHSKSFKTRWKPGTIHSYNNPGYVLAGHLIEVLAERPYYEYIKDEILTPLGMSESGFYFNKPASQDFASGYDSNGKFDDIPYVHIQGGPAGDLASNAEEMAQFLQFMINRKGSIIDEDVFNDEMFDRIENPQTTSTAKYGVWGGYGLGNFQVWQKGYIFHGHNGGIDGYSSRYIYSKEADLGIAVATNTTKDVTLVMEFILDAILKESIKEPFDKKEEYLEESLAHTLEGYYVFKGNRLKLRDPIMQFAGDFKIKYEDNKLLIKNVLGGVRDSLTYAGNNKFYRSKEAEPSIVFYKADNGKMAIGVKRKYAERESFLLGIITNASILLSMIISSLYLAYSGIWFLIQLFKKKTPITKDRLILFIACFSFPLMVLAFITALSNRQTCGELTFFSGLMFLSSILMLIFTLWSIFRSFKIDGTKSFKLTYRISALAICIITIFFAYHGFIGLRLWNY